ncbi:MAG: hypothetical protein ACLTSZ_02305 [Lachnospiraceae bacterium]
MNTALNETGAQLVKNGMCVTQAAEEEPLILEEPEGELEDAGAVDSPEQDTKQTDGESAQDIDIIIEPSDQEVNTGSEPSDSSVISSAIPGVSDTAQPSTPSHSDADDGVASPVPDRGTDRTAGTRYLRTGTGCSDKKVETAKKEKEAAEQALMQYQQEQLTAADASGKEQERQLLAAVQTAGDAYEDAVLAANEAAVTAGRAVAAAGISDASDSTLAVREITVEQMELQLEKLERLLEADGRICAPSDGLITEIAVNIGSGRRIPRRSDGGSDKGLSVYCRTDKGQETYVGAGDEVTLTDSRRNQLEQLTVESVAADGENEGVYEISVPLPDDTLELGAAAVLDYSSPSQTYAICVPLAALHLDERNQPYVLTYDEQDSVLGKELRARKVSVNILDQNESYAALADGSISSQDEVIVSADKAVDDGSRIRLES